MKLVYVIDENYKNELLLQGFKLINETKIDNKTCWILKPKLNFDLKTLDNSKSFCNNKMNF
jgi:hypothetical protein